MTISLIAAVSENNVIGAGGGMPWRLPGDLKHFKKITLNSPIIMGRKTFESFGSKPLPKRTNIILTRDQFYSAKGIVIAHSFESAQDTAKQNLQENKDEIFIIGGENIFSMSLKLADKLYLTKVHKEVQGDTFFPKVDFNQWHLVSSEAHQKDENNSDDYTFEVYTKR